MKDAPDIAAKSSADANADAFAGIGEPGGPMTAQLQPTASAETKSAVGKGDARPMAGAEAKAKDAPDIAAKYSTAANVDAKVAAR